MSPTSSVPGTSSSSSEKKKGTTSTDTGLGSTKTPETTPKLSPTTSVPTTALSTGTSKPNNNNKKKNKKMMKLKNMELFIFIFILALFQILYFNTDILDNVKSVDRLLAAVGASSSSSSSSTGGFTGKLTREDLLVMINNSDEDDVIDTDTTDTPITSHDKNIDNNENEEEEEEEEDLVIKNDIDDYGFHKDDDDDDGNDDIQVLHDIIENDNRTKDIVIIGAGQGTTGTHLIFDATVYMGLTSVHWWDLSVSRGIEDSMRKAFGNITEKEVRSIKEFDAHYKLIGTYMGKFRCLQKQQLNQNKRCGSAIEWKTKLLDLIDTIVKGGQIQAFHDTPYPNLLPHLIDSLRRHNKKPIVILSERDPEQYATRRANHTYGGDPICIDPPPFVNDENDSSSFHGGGLDPIGCIDYAISKSDKDDLDVADVLVSSWIYNKPNSTENANLVNALAIEMKSYQDLVRRRADFTFNMFEQKEKMKVSDFVSLLKEKISILQNIPDLPKSKKKESLRKPKLLQKEKKENKRKQKRRRQ